MPDAADQIIRNNLPDGQFPSCFQFGRLLPWTGYLDRTFWSQIEAGILYKCVIQDRWNFASFPLPGPKTILLGIPGASLSPTLGSTSLTDIFWSPTTSGPALQDLRSTRVLTTCVERIKCVLSPPSGFWFHGRFRQPRKCYPGGSLRTHRATDTRSLD